MFDEAKAQKTLRFIENLKHTKGIWHGQNFKLLPWQEEIIRTIFGTVKPDGYRQYNTAYIEIPKKNGKSELAAAVALYMTCGDGEWGAEVYGCASDRQQASIVFDVAVDMVDQCPALKKRIKPVMSTKRLVYQPTNSFYQVLSAEAYTKHGLNVHAVIFDELHSQPTRELFDVMVRGSGDARKQPLYFLITTAGTDRNSICYEQHQKAEDIIAGRKIDPTFYPVIYGAADDDDWTDEKVWYKANPSLGHTQMVQDLEGMGFTVVPFGQGYKDMSPPTKELMKLVLEQRIAHGGHPVLRWMMDNVFVRTDPAGNIKMDKEKSTEKIDAAVATVMALDRAIRNANKETGSVYDRRGGILFI